MGATARPGFDRSHLDFGIRHDGSLQECSDLCCKFVPRSNAFVWHMLPDLPKLESCSFMPALTFNDRQLRFLQPSGMQPFDYNI